MTLHYNYPTSPPELQIFKVLRKRMTLSQDSLTFYRNLQKGYEGEIKFHKLLKKYVVSDCIVLYDLLLDCNDSLFQLDCIIIQQRNISHIEVKNYEGDFMLKDNMLYTCATEKEINNPLGQTERERRLLNELQKKHGYEFPVSSYVVFVNEEFALYLLQPKLPLILPNQIHRFINNKINNTHSKLSSTHYELAHKLLSLRVSKPLSDRLPKYEFEQLRKGIHCLYCDGFLTTGDFHGRKLVCDTCRCMESRESAVLRSVDEYSILFPESKITTNTIWKWCDRILSKFKIRKILFQFLQPVGSQKQMYFVSLSKKRF